MAPLSNAVNLRMQTTIVTALSEVDPGAGPTAPTHFVLAARPDLSHDWQVILQVEPHLGRAGRAVACRKGGPGCTRTSGVLPAPEIGAEREDGIRVFASWADARIVLDFDIDPADRTDLVSAGWTFSARRRGCAPHRI